MIATSYIAESSQSEIDRNLNTRESLIVRRAHMFVKYVCYFRERCRPSVGNKSACGSG